MTPAVRNLTPHSLRVVDAHGAELLVLPPAETPARIVQIVHTETVDPAGVPWRTIDYGEPIGLPVLVPGTVLVVSRPVAERLRRADLVFPDDEVRDTEGRIVGCRALARFTNQTI